MRRPLVASAALALLVALLQQLGCSAVRTLNQQPGGSGPNPSTSGKPNFVVILTDDQDLMLNSTHPHYMPALNRLIADKGITFNQFYASSPECCPSRVNLWVGRYAHNTNITTNKGPHGAYEKFQVMQLDSDYLPGWLQDLGYKTYFTGKFLNQFKLLGKPDRKTGLYRIPKYWDDFVALTEPNIYDYFDPTFTRNGEERQRVEGYVNDLLTAHALDIIQQAAADQSPFYIHISTPAPHQGIDADNEASGSKPPPPAPRHAGLYPDVQVPRLPNYDEADLSDKPRRVREFGQEGLSLTRFRENAMTELYRKRLQSLRSVDEMIEQVVAALEERGQLDNTYFFFLSDNGYHIGSHGMAAGKRTPFNEDVRVPLFVRGPGISPGSSTSWLSTMVDIAPTILRLAGGKLRGDLDGMPLPLYAFDPTALGNWQRDIIPYELWTEQGAEKDNSVIYKGMTACAPEEALTRRLDPQGLSIVTLAPAATALSWGSSSSSSNGNAGPATSAEATTASSPIREEPVGTYTAFGRKEKAGDNSTGLVAAPGAYPGADQLNVTLVANLLAQYASGKRVAARRRSKRLDPLFEKLALAAQRSGEASFEAYAPQRAAVTPLSASVGPRGRILNTCFKFNLWCVDNELELYNLAADPFEMENLYSNAAKHAPWLVNRLNALLAVITACEGLDCADPVRAAHAADLSSGAPMTFEDSLAERHDAFYASLPRPRFRKCLGVYDHDNELNWFRAVARQRKANPPPTAALVEGDLA